MTLNLATILTEAAKESPTKPVALFDGGRMTYAELDALSDRFAAGLRRDEIGPGDAVGLQLPNLPHFLIAYFGILKNGSVVVPLNVLLKAPEVEYHLHDSDAKALITWSGFADEAAKGAAGAGVDRLYTVDLTGGKEPAVGAPFDRLLAELEGPAPFQQTDPGDTAAIIYTSGTTGRPKGAELSHFQLYMNADTPGRVFGVRSTDVVLVVLPLFHVFGLSSILNVCVRFAGTMSLVPRFDPTTVLEVIQRDQVTIFEGVPTMYISLLNHPAIDQYDLSSLRIGISGGAAIAAEVLDSFERRFGIVILEGYGLSETASTATLLRRWRNILGRTMWEFPGGPVGGNRFLVIGLGSGEAADLTLPSDRDDLIAYGPLLSDDGAVWLGTSVLVRAPDAETARMVLTADRYADIEVHRWQFGGRS